MTNTQKDIIDFIKHHSTATISTLADAIEADIGNIQQAVHTLVETGVILRLKGAVCDKYVLSGEWNE